MKKILIKNKKAGFEYEVIEKYEAGIVLTGTEVKSIRLGKISFNGAFCVITDGEVFLKGTDISRYEEGTYNNHDPKRDRKLLLHRKQINKIEVKIDEKGLTVIPLAIYNNDRNIFKLEIAVAKGRKSHDKREYIKERDDKRQIKDALKR